MDYPRRRKKPVAIVALGDPAMGDDGVAVRVMGRVRPILGEIALTGSGADALAHRVRRSKSKAPSRTPKSPNVESNGPHSLVSLVDWIEGLCPDEMLRPVLSGRRRVVLIDTVSHDRSPGHVRHWHISHEPRTGLNMISFYGGEDDESFDHLPFWLEDDMPVHGTDLIAIEPYKIEASHDLSMVLRSRLAGITAQVGGLLVRILEEEGWRFGQPAGPARRTRRKRVA